MKSNLFLKLILKITLKYRLQLQIYAETLTADKKNDVSVFASKLKNLSFKPIGLNLKKRYRTICGWSANVPSEYNKHTIQHQNKGS